MSTILRFQIRIVGPDGVRVERLRKPEVVLGRSAQADVIIANPEVSRKHVTLRLDGAQLLVVDEGSKNGTFLNGIRLPAQTSQVWPVGQTLKLGLAPELLTLELAEAARPDPSDSDATGIGATGPGVTGLGPVNTQTVYTRTLNSETEKLSRESSPVDADSPPPMDSVIKRIPVRRTVVKGPEDAEAPGEDPRPEKFITKVKTERPVKTASIHEKTQPDLGLRTFEPKAGTAAEPPPQTEPAVAKSQSAVAPAAAPPDLRGDLEKRMQEILARAEAEAKNLRSQAERESEIVKSMVLRERRQAEQEAEAIQLERARIESQLRDLREELKSRQDERRALAREHADARLQLQNIQQELLRAEAARKQLPSELTRELADLEKKIEAREKELERQTEALKTQAQKEAREIIETAKKQAELILQDAETKAKSQRDKLQAQIATERQAIELDLADLKLKQVAELKAAEEQLERQWRAKRDEVARGFLADARAQIEKIAYGSNLESGIKLRLITALEESLHQHFVKKIHEPSEETVVSARVLPRPKEELEAETNPNIRVDIDKDVPPPVPRFKLKKSGLGVVAAAVILAVGWFLGRQGKGVSADRATASSGPVVAVESRPVAQVVPAPPSGPAVSPSAPASAPSRPQPTWREVLTGTNAASWRESVARYMLESLQIDRTQMARYQEIEEAARSELERLPANSLESARVEELFVRSASQLLGAANYQNLVAYRAYFLSKKQ